LQGVRAATVSKLEVVKGQTSTQACLFLMFLKLEKPLDDFHWSQRMHAALWCAFLSRGSGACRVCSGSARQLKGWLVFQCNAICIASSFTVSPKLRLNCNVGVGFGNQVGQVADQIMFR